MLIRFFSLAMLIAVGVEVYVLFRIKDEVANLKYQLEIASKQIKAEKDSIHLLKAEQAFLSSPSRLKNLAVLYLELDTIKTDQIVKDPLVSSLKTSSIDPFYVNGTSLNNRISNKVRYKKLINNKYMRTVSAIKNE